MYADFERDLAGLIATCTPNGNEEAQITIDDFCNYFMRIHPWNDPREMDGTALNIRKLLVSDRDSKIMNDERHPGHEHSLVDRHGNINIFNLRVMAFLLCKGQYTYKSKCLYQLLWDRKDALEKKPVLSWSHLHL